MFNIRLLDPFANFITLMTELTNILTMHAARNFNCVKKAFTWEKKSNAAEACLYKTLIIHIKELK